MKKIRSKLHPCSIIYILCFVFFISGVVVFFVSPSIERNSESNEGYMIAINYSWITIFFSLIVALVTAVICKIENLPYIVKDTIKSSVRK